MFLFEAGLFEQIREWLWFLNPKVLIDTLLQMFGVWVYLPLFLIVFAETGLAIGFFLPGDSLLVVAGILAAANKLNVLILLPVLFAASVIGDSVGYFIGRTMGRSLLDNQKSWFFRPSHVQKAHDFFEKNGTKTIVIARFLPIIRSFIPPVAGAVNMSYPKFLFYSVLGGFLWIFSMVLAGYFLASIVEEAVKRMFGLPEFKLEEHIEKVVVVCVVASALPLVIEIIRNRRKKKVETTT
ncbi:MAG: VTT domain-containing protein [Pyrinomonadaceae bacterium]|nr:VTT domain-containing protein [Pyrinomonadaceae bacterium]